jgi:cytochrome c oxidase cbb3-type subunit 3
VAGKRETDSISGTETTGHEWDGIKELNTPLPRWWLWTFYASILWAFGYWIVMPAWPLISGYTHGVIGYSSRAAVAERLQEARAAQSSYVNRINASTLEEIRADPELLEFAIAGGRSAFAVNCSQCHGQGAAGAPGYPNLNDDEWLWGGTLQDISTTITHGIRSQDPDTHESAMPAFVRDGILTREQANDVAEYVLSLSGSSTNPAAAKRGAKIFEEQCVPCHQKGGTGSIEVGAPDLANKIWLYGGSKATILTTIEKGRHGVMPAWGARLSKATIKELTIYVYSLGGGQQ